MGIFPVPHDNDPGIFGMAEARGCPGALIGGLLLLNRPVRAKFRLSRARMPSIFSSCAIHTSEIPVHGLLRSTKHAFLLLHTGVQAMCAEALAVPSTHGYYLVPGIYYKK